MHLEGQVLGQDPKGLAHAPARDAAADGAELTNQLVDLLAQLTRRLRAHADPYFPGLPGPLFDVPESAEAFAHFRIALDHRFPVAAHRAPGFQIELLQLA